VPPKKKGVMGGKNIRDKAARGGWRQWLASCGSGDRHKRKRSFGSDAWAPNLTKVADVLRDGGCSGEKFAKAVRVLMEAEAVTRDEMHGFAVPPKRRAVERSFGRLEKFRRLWRNCERKMHATLQMTALAFISLLLNRY
jgi:transposase